MMQHRTISPAVDKKQGAGGARASRSRASRPLLALGLALVAGFGLSIRPPAAAAATLTFQVTTTTDAPDASPGDGICADAAGQCTLRAAVQEADAQPSGSAITIVVPAGTFPLKLGVLSLTANTITVQGASGGATTVDGRNASQVFNVSPAASVTLGQVTISHGSASLGGAIQNAGTLMLTSSTVAASAANNGGGIYNAQGGTLALAGTTVSQNVAGRDGGGIANNGGTLQLSLSTASGKNSEGGGGIANGDGTLTVDKSTISGNSTNSGTGGSAIFNILTTSVSNITITDPLLARLASNGGPTQTQALEAGSPAIDRGGTSANGCPPADQRGVTRPQGPACDIGAFEFVP